MVEILNTQDERPYRPYDFYIDRRSPVGNPYRMLREDSRDKVCDYYEEHFARMLEVETPHPPGDFVRYLNKILDALLQYGRVRLFCWCAPKRCHGETIKRWLEKEEKKRANS